MHAAAWSRTCFIKDARVRTYTRIHVGKYGFRNYVAYSFLLQTELGESSVATSRTLVRTQKQLEQLALQCPTTLTKVRVRACRPRSGLPAVYVVTLPPPGLEGKGLSVSLGENVSLPDWKRGVSLPDWKAGVSLPDLKRGVSLPELEGNGLST